jgi:phage terminase small subunit
MEYKKDRNATQAAIRAGYSKNGARVTASKLLSNPNIQAHVKQVEAEIQNNIKFTIEDWRNDLVQIARSNLTEFVEINPIGIAFKDGIANMPEEKQRQLSEISETIGQSGTGSQKIKLKDSMKAYDMLGKHMGAYEKDNNQGSAPTMVIENLDGTKIHLGMGDKE